MTKASPTYRMIWRWHFYAGLFVMPFILILSVSGAAYLFKPQLDRSEESDFRDLPQTGKIVPPSRQVAVALAAWPGAQFQSYRLPEKAGDAAMVHLALPNGAMFDAFISPQGRLLGTIDPESRLSATIARFHGSLMIGRLGDLLVELAASWAIVMILTGLYLWWPERTGLAGVVWPRLASGGRGAWRDLHAVAGFWVSGLALVMLLTGLPWAGVWGQAFGKLRTEMGWVQGPQNWKTGSSADPHAAHDHTAMVHQRHPAAADLTMLDLVVRKGAAERMAFPVLVLRPGAPQRFGPPTGDVWTVKSESQNRPLNHSVFYAPVTGQEVGRDDFADKHIIDRVVNYGIAWHEGQLLGVFNQIVGVLTASLLIVLAISGFLMWRRRAPAAGLGAPAAVPATIKGVTVITVLFALLLPLLGASLILLWIVERLVLSRIPAASRWLGLQRHPI